jgi:hypothetical protein
VVTRVYNHMPERSFGADITHRLPPQCHD